MIASCGIISLATNAMAAEPRFKKSMETIVISVVSSVIAYLPMRP